MALVIARNVLLALGILACALAAGFFYAFSVAVMPGLAVADPLSAIDVMRGINAVIRTPVFAFAFFGGLAFPLLAAAVALATRSRRVALAAAMGGLVYGLGVVAVTFAFNVPLNQALAAASPTAENAAAVWRDFAEPWTAWNHVRALTTLLSFALAAAALVLGLRRPGS